MKRTVSFLLAMLMSLTAFGAATAFAGVFGAGAEFYDYFNYIQIPGFTAFSEEGLKAQGSAFVDFHGFTTDVLPEGNVVDKVATFEVKATDEWGGIELHTFKRRNKLNEMSGNWSANDLIDGTDIFGDTDYTFEGASGITLWVKKNGEQVEKKVSLALFQVPCQGPYYTSSEDNNSQDMMDYTKGFVYSSDGKYPDEDGYVYFDFKTDFKQSDWWSKDDNGDNQYDMGITPIPKSKIPLISGMRIGVGACQPGDLVSVGDIRICIDKRIHVDALDEAIIAFDSIDSAAYTEESYLAASEVYLRAYEIFLDPEHQTQVDDITSELEAAIANLKPLFHAHNKDIILDGFDAWSDEELDSMIGGLDTVVREYDIVSPNSDSSLLVMANAMEGAPTWGWSWFTNLLPEEGTAIGNPFALKEGSALLSESDGISFWVKWDESLTQIPDAMRVGVGSSTSGVYFECEDYAITLPESEGYIGVPWSTLYDYESDADVYDYIDELDYIAIMLNGATGIYYISDLRAFNWSLSAADFDDLKVAINDAYTYMNGLEEGLYYYKSWDRVMAAIAAAEEIIGAYAVTQEDVTAAQDAISTNINKLVLNKDLATRETMAELEALYAAGKSYWRGNVTPASYRLLMENIANAERLIEEGAKQTEAEEVIAGLDAAIDALVPISASEKVTTIHSFESYTNRELNKANGDRTEGVNYSLANAANVPNIPEGYDKALMMVATKDLYASNTDEHGVMQFKAMSRDTGSVVPIKLGLNGENTLIGDLTGTEGICLWIGVNDVNLVQDCSFRFAVSNCTEGPLFERAAHDIPLPSTGNGWLYIPWEYFEFYDEWTKGEPINLAKIFFYILRFNGEVKQGLEVYATGIHAYKSASVGEWEAPVIENVTEGQTIDVSEAGFIPKWNAGTATLDGANFVFGNAVVTNGEHVLEVRNGNKTASVTFTVTGGKDKEYAIPEVYGVKEGGEYTSAMVDWSEGTATLNGVVLEKGTTLSTPGEYTLVVVNGNQTVSVNFKIVEPKPDVMKGDPDGDGMITVADALYTLRIAAQLTEGTADDLLVVDIDGDGSVTVADALAILRVAAQLVESL